jgi:hypothetical protein
LIGRIILPKKARRKTVTKERKLKEVLTSMGWAMSKQSTSSKATLWCGIL